LTFTSLATPSYSKTRAHIVTALAAGLIIANTAQADISVTAHISTIGPGVEFGYKFTPSLGWRAGWQQFATDFDFKPEDENGVPGDELNYNGNLNLKNGSVLADWYPFQARLRLSAGLLLNNSATKLVTNCQTNTSGAAPIASNCEIGSASVPSSDIDELRIAIDFEQSIAPYLGIGWVFQPDNTWFLSSDLGFAYLGKAKVDIQSSGSCNTASTCRAQLDQEERELEHDMESLKFFPIAKLSLGYRF